MCNLSIDLPQINILYCIYIINGFMRYVNKGNFERIVKDKHDERAYLFYLFEFISVFVVKLFC